MNILMLVHIVFCLISLGAFATGHLVWTPTVSAEPKLPKLEYDALFSFYTSLNGSHWQWRNETFGTTWSFGSSANPCADNWQGLNCSADPDGNGNLHVLEIRLSRYALRGTLPTSIGAFASLAVLALADNAISGTLPQAIAQLSNLSRLYINRNALHGTLPVALGGLAQLEVVNVGVNAFTGAFEMVLCTLPRLAEWISHNNPFHAGPVPICMNSSSTLRVFDLEQTQRTGTLPHTLVGLPVLETLMLGENDLTGTVPEEWYTNMTQLRRLGLRGNALTGMLSPLVCGLSALQLLEVSANKLSGTLPGCIGELSALRLLDVGANDFTGQVPAGISSLSSLRVLIMYINHFSGTLPTFLCGMSGLLELDLGGNNFHGTIPHCYGDLYNLRRLYLDINDLTGTFPSALCNLTEATFLYLRENQLHGQLPDCVGQLTHMQNFYVYVNEFSGTLPAAWSTMRSIQFLDVGSNQLQGTIPASFADMVSLQYLFLNDNQLSGTLPPELGSLENLKDLLLQRNKLTGTIPATYSQLWMLNVLAVDHNALTGSLDGMVDATRQSTLHTLKLNNNAFTGSVPATLFQLPELRVLVGAVNCFHGLLPSAICNATTLYTLSLDGMSTAKPCRRKILPRVSDSFVTLSADEQPLPACLLALPHLQTLHLSGNSFTGTLPDVALTHSRLQDVALSHNHLTGVIPDDFQLKGWYFLDLSYNRLTGTLHSDFGAGLAMDFAQDDYLPMFNVTLDDVGRTLALENNRLSGRIPGSVVDMQNVSILGSNMFSCDLRRTDLPEHDPGAYKYDCGSTQFDVPYYTWLVLTGVCAGIVMVALRWCSTHPTVSAQLARMKAWLAAVNGEPVDGQLGALIPNTALVSRVSRLVCERAALCCALIVLVVLPLYAVLNAYYGTMTVQYTYRVSAAFLTGEVAMRLECTALLAVVLVFVVLLVPLLREYALKEDQIRASAVSQPVVVDEGGAKTKASVVLVRAENPLAVLLWNSAVYIVFGAFSLAVVVGVNVAYLYVVIYKSANLLLFVQIIIAAFKIFWNGMISYHIVRYARQSIVADGSHTSALETRFIMVQVLNALLNNIAIPFIVVAVVSPSCFYNVFSPAPAVETPFTYVLCTDFKGNKCSSAEVVSTSSVYQPAFDYSYQCSSSMITYYAPVFVAMCVIGGFVVPAVELAGKYLLHHTDESGWLHAIIAYYLPSIFLPLGKRARIAPTKRFVQINRLAISITTYLGLLLTFGAVFPPLAVALTVTLIQVTYYAKLKVGWFLCSAMEEGRLNAVGAVEAECQRAGAVEVLRRSSWLLVALTCAFYTLFLFDTLGDTVGVKRAYWVLIVIPLVPPAIYLAYVAWRKMRTAHQDSPNITSIGQGSVSIEMKPATAEVAEGISVHDWEGEVQSVIHSESH